MTNEIKGPNFEQLELDALDVLCQMFETNRADAVGPQTLARRCKLTDKDIAEVVYRRMVGLGAIEEETIDTGPMGFIRTSRIHPMVFEITSQRKARAEAMHEPPDRVAGAERWLRTHPRWSILVIAFLGLTAFITLINQLTQLYDRFTR